MPSLHRIVTPEDASIPELQRLLDQQSPGQRAVSPADLSEALRNDNYRLLILKEEPTAYLGMGSIFFQKNLARWIAEIHDIVVDEPQRGRGYGRVIVNGLLDVALEFSKEKDAKIKLYLTSRPAREAANKLYTDLGFRLVATADGAWGTNLYKIIVEPTGLRSR